MTENFQNMHWKIKNAHRNIPTRPEIVKNVSCIKIFDEIKKQKNHEALIILKVRLSINQDFSNVLKISLLIFYKIILSV